MADPGSDEATENERLSDGAEATLASDDAEADSAGDANGLGERRHREGFG